MTLEMILKHNPYTQIILIFTIYICAYWRLHISKGDLDQYVQILYQTIAHLDSSAARRSRIMHDLETRDVVISYI